MYGMTRREARQSVGARVKALREARGLSVERLEELSDIPEFMIRALEAGNMRVTFENIVCLARGMRVRVEEIVDPEEYDGRTR